MASSSTVMRCTVFFSALSFLVSSASACDFNLASADFEQGTYRITESGKYCLTENIVFNPLPGTIDAPNSNFNWFPTDASAYPACDSLTGGAFALGYFAAISIETNDVEIDMATYSISQSFSYYIQQRFFSLIEIGQ